MKCPYCGYAESKVTDSRPSSDEQIKRRRECLSCKGKFTTYESIEREPVIILKKSGKKELFNKKKLINGLLRACANRPVTSEDINRIADNIEHKLYSDAQKEYSSGIIGECALEELKKIDGIAYVRFASVYKKFDDIKLFIEELQKLVENEK